MNRALKPAKPTKKAKRVTPTPLIPRRVIEPTLNDHLEVMSRAIFQAGLSWSIIASRWPAFQLAFDGFDAARVAQYDAFDLERLMAAEGIIHSAKKIAGTVDNAKALIFLHKEFADVKAYVATFACYADLLADARTRFAFVGDLSCYYWLFRTGNPVPPFETWIAVQAKDHPRMREMVLLGRSEATSSERPGF